MANAAEVSEELVRTLKACLEELALVRSRRVDLEGFLEQAEELQRSLAEFNTEIVELTVRDQAEAMVVASRMWDEQEPGILRDGEGTLARLVTASEPLRTLYQYGISITSIHKFSDDERAFAQHLGDNFDSLTEPWLRVPKSGNGTLSLRFRRHQLEAVMKLVRALEDLDVGTSSNLRRPDFASNSRGDMVQMTVAQAKRQDRNCPMRLSFKRGDGFGSRLAFVEGEWLNAYAYDIVRDHLHRNGVDHEIYTNVAYRAPGDILRQNGEFDVLVQAAGKVAIFECKTGRLDEGRGECGQVRSKTDGLMEVLAATDAGLELYSYLVFNPESTDPTDAATALAGSAVQPIKPSDLRRTVAELFRSN